MYLDVLFRVRRVYCHLQISFTQHFRYCVDSAPTLIKLLVDADGYVWEVDVDLVSYVELSLTCFLIKIFFLKILM